MQPCVRLPGRKSAPLSYRTQRQHTNSHCLGPFLTHNQELPFSPGTWLQICLLLVPLSHKAALWLQRASLHFFILVSNTAVHYYYLHHSQKKKKKNLAYNQSHSHCYAALMAAVWLQTIVKKYESELHLCFIIFLNNLIKKGEKEGEPVSPKLNKGAPCSIWSWTQSLKNFDTWRGTELTQDFRGTPSVEQEWNQCFTVAQAFDPVNQLLLTGECSLAFEIAVICINNMKGWINRATIKAS